ncbi:MAG: hypothetical protein ABSG26_09665 [Bryobacteraceae bacterium]
MARSPSFVAEDAAGAGAASLPRLSPLTMTVVCPIMADISGARS